MRQPATSARISTPMSSGNVTSPRVISLRFETVWSSTRVDAPSGAMN